MKQSTLDLSPNIKDIKLVKSNNSENLPATKKKAIKQSFFTKKAGATTTMTDSLMANHSLFQPLIADPKWPRFTLAKERARNNFSNLLYSIKKEV